MPETYENLVTDIARRASSMRKTLVDPFRNDDGSFIMPTTRSEQEKRNRILESAISDSHYSMTENGKMIAAIHARTLQGYEQKYGRLPKLHVPQRGDNVRLVELACKNAFEEAQRVTGREERVSAILAQLGKMLAIEPPGRIESYDISNISVHGADHSPPLFPL